MLVISTSSYPAMSPGPPQDVRSHRIACIPADGIGPEVIDAGVTVLKTLAETLGTFKLDFTNYDWSSDTYKRTGKYIPDGGLEQLKKHDAVFFGAVGAPDVPDHISLWGLRLAICQPFQQYANVRPTRILRGTQSPLRNVQPGDLDWVIVRENSEGEYAGQGGRSHRGQPWEVATEVAIFTRHAIERIMRFAFETARSRPRKLLTVVSKGNAQRNGMVLWDEVAVEVAKEFPDVTVDKMLVDAMTCRMVLKPESIDTVVATNLVCVAQFVPS
jgi:isocitrate/isopropylmalate dehydrogenase